MKRIVVTFFILVIVIQNGFCLIGEIFEAVKWVAGQVNEVTEEIFRKSMIANTIETLSVLKKNYEDSVRFYNELKYIQENPYRFAEDTKQEFLNRLENPVTKFWDEVNKKQREIDMKDNKKWYEKGIASYAEEKTLGAGLEYVKSNWNFGDKIVDAMNKRHKQIEKLPDKLASDNKATVESAKNELLLLQLESQENTNALLLKLIEIQNKQIEEQLLERQRILARRQLYTKTAEELLKSKREKVAQQTSREEYIKKVIGATSEKEIRR